MKSSSSTLSSPEGGSLRLRSRVAGWLAAALLVAAAIGVAYAAALARLPEQRARIEALLERETGLAVRFSGMSLRLGFYGPEAEFTNLTLSSPEDGAVLLQAASLLARFETWRLLRSGQLRPGRVVLRGAEVQLKAWQRRLPQLRAAEDAGSPAVGASLESRALVTLTTLLRSLPVARLELESALLVWEQSDADSPSVRIRAPRVQYARTAEAANLVASLLLPPRLGRSLFVTASLRAAQIGTSPSGSVRIVARGARLQGLRELLPASSLQLSGRGDVLATLRFRDGLITQGDASLNLRELEWDGSPGRRGALPRLQAEGQLTRRGNALQVSIADLRVDSDERLPWSDGSLQLAVDLGTHATRLQAAALPVPALLALQSLAGSSVLPQIEPGSLRGVLPRLELEWVGQPLATLPGRVSAAFEDVAWDPAAGEYRVQGLAGTFDGDQDRISVQFDSPEALILRGSGASQRALPLLGKGRAQIIRSDAQWLWMSQALRARLGAVPLQLDAALSLAPGAPRQYVLRAILEGATSLQALTELASFFAPRGELPREPDATRFDFGGRASAATLEWVGTLPQAGQADDAVRRARLTLQDAALRIGDGWPSLQDLDGVLRLDGKRLELQIAAARTGELAIASGDLVARTDPTLSLDRVRLELSGQLADAAALLAAAPLAGEPLVWLPQADSVIRWLRGPAEMTLDWSAARTARDAANWRLVAKLERFGGADGPSQWRIQPVPKGARGRVQLRGEGQAAASAWDPLLIDALGLDAAQAVSWRAEAEQLGRGAVANRWRVQLSIAERGSASMEWNLSTPAAPVLLRGGFRFGAGRAELPQAAVLVSGSVRELDLLAALRGAATSILAAESTAPLQGRLAVENLRWGGVGLGTHTVQLSRAGDEFRTELRGDAISGSVRIAGGAIAAAQQLRVRLDQLRLPRSSLDELRSAAWFDAPLSADVRIARLRVGTTELGVWQGRVDSDSESVSAPALQFDATTTRGTAQLNCRRQPLRCELHARARGADLGNALALVERALPLRSETFDAELRWIWSAGAPVRGMVTAAAQRVAWLAGAAGAGLVAPVVAALDIDPQLPRTSAALDLSASYDGGALSAATLSLRNPEQELRFVRSPGPDGVWSSEALPVATAAAVTR